MTKAAVIDDIALPANINDALGRNPVLRQPLMLGSHCVSQSFAKP